MQNFNTHIKNTFARMTSLLFLLLSVLAIQECWGTEIYASEKDCHKGEAFLDAAAEMIAKAKENMRTCSNDTSDVSKKPRDCHELQQLGNSKNGVYTVWIRKKFFEEKRLNVYCDMTTDGGGWTVIQRRGDYSTPIDYFYRGWYSYKEGFGDLQKEFWFGNDNIFGITNQKRYSVRFDLKAKSGDKAYAHYSLFWIDGEFHKYTIHIKNYTGNAGDSMTYHDGQKFSTRDRDNCSSRTRHCAQDFKGAWWYNACYEANLNGLRGVDKNATNAVWSTFKDDKMSLKDVEIKIRPISLK